jgi:hypothetical protein
MGTIKSIERFPYEGKAYNLVVTSFGDLSGPKQTLYQGVVHPDYPMYKNTGMVCKISELQLHDVVVERDKTFWRVEMINEYLVNEDFQQITLSDGRVLKCSLAHKLRVISPKKCPASMLEAGDELADVDINCMTKKKVVKKILKG